MCDESWIRWRQFRQILYPGYFPSQSNSRRECDVCFRQCLIRKSSRSKSGFPRCPSSAPHMSRFGVTTAFALDPQKTITQYSHQSWGGADGLDQVFSIAQTTDGYIWVGAANGLFRFDGFHFKQWEAGPKEPRLPGPAFQLLGAKDGSLWIASTGHMLRFERDQMTDFPLPGVPLGSIIYKLQEGRDGTLWSATSSGLFKFARGQWQKVELPDNFKNPSVSALLIDRGDTVWAGVVDFDFSGIRYQPRGQKSS